jgi:hypothetical protein
MAIINAQTVHLRRDEYRQLIETIDALQQELRAMTDRRGLERDMRSPGLLLEQVRPC